MCNLAICTWAAHIVPDKKCLLCFGHNVHVNKVTGLCVIFKKFAAYFDQMADYSEMPKMVAHFRSRDISARKSDVRDVGTETSSRWQTNILF